LLLLFIIPLVTTHTENAVDTRVA